VRVWKMMGGEGSKFWREFVIEGVAAMKANEEGDLYGYSSRKEFLERVGGFSVLGKKNSINTCTDAWNFISCLKQGDLLLLYRRGYVSALGFVTGEYTYHDGKMWRCEKFFHRRPVAWKMLDTSKQKLSPHLKNTLLNLHGKLEEINEKEDILEVCHIAASALFCQGQKQLS